MSSVYRSQRHQSYYHRPHRMSTALLLELTKPFHHKLLDKAKRSLRSDQNEMAVILPQAASEMCTEWALTALLKMRNDHDLAEPILDLFRASDICNDRLRRIYTTLSKDNVQRASFWQTLKSHHSRRHNIVHKGAKCTHDEAQESVGVVGQYVHHVETILNGLQRAQDKGKGGS